MGFPRAAARALLQPWKMLEVPGLEADVIYSRVSAKAQLRGGGPERQQLACAPLAQDGAEVVVEAISGKAPTARRQRLVIVESAIARNLRTSEELYELAGEHETDIVCADIPRFFAHDPAPAEGFVRQVMGGPL